MEKKIQLKRHKAIALSILLTMAALYILMIYLQKQNPAPWIGYVKAFSEAGMVGGLADWFAVTALFHYPLGIKIPHTNLIKNNKDALGKNLGLFVTQNFLTPQTIKPYIQKLIISNYLKNWIEKPKNKEFISLEVLKILQNVFQSLDNYKTESIIKEKATLLWHQVKLEHWIAHSLKYILKNDEHNRLITLLMPNAKKYVDNNREMIYNKIIDSKPILAIIGGKMIANEFAQGIISFFDEIERDKNHSIRHFLSEKLYETIHEIENSNKWKEKIQNIKHTILPDEKIESIIRDFWKNMRTDIETMLLPDNKIHLFITNYIHSIAQQLDKNPGILKQIDDYAQKMVYKIALKNSSEIGNIIEKTIDSWNGEELSKKLELEVGRDLQFIRINGTLVGGLVGLAIYTITHFFS